MMRLFLSLLLLPVTLNIAVVFGHESGRASATLAQANSASLKARAGTDKPAQAANNAESSGAAAFADQQTLDFVRGHQAELADLLEFMRIKQPGNYQSAIRQIARSKQRLENLSERDKEMHAIELSLWKINSQLRLLAARMSAGKKDGYNGLLVELRNLILQEQSLSEAKLQLERTRTLARLKSLDEQLEKLHSHRDEAIDKAIKTWELRAEKQSPEKKQNLKKNSSAETAAGTAN